MNQYPDRNRAGGNPQNRPAAPSQNGQRTPDPRREAARRAYLAKRRKQKRRARIILTVAALVILALLITLVVLIVKGIAAAIRGGEDPGKDSSTDTLPAWSESVSTDGTEVQTDSETRQTQGEVQTTEPVIDDEPVYELDFKTDLSIYEIYMDPADRDSYLVLVNPSHPLGANDEPDDLIDVANTRTDGRAMQKMRKTAEKALEALYAEVYAEGMISAASPSGYPLSVTSAYRDYGTQNYLFNQYTQNEMAANPKLSQAQAEAIVETYSCRPGTSEHQTGLCCDMHNLAGADVSFAKQEVAGWLEENAWKFGFILRFPENKVKETGISYEPWHFRFVGRYHAYRIHEAGLCLEEYIEQLNNN